MKNPAYSLVLITAAAWSPMLVGCDFLAKKASEKAIEAATGNEVSIDGKKVEIKTKDGKTAVIATGDNQVTIKTDDGEAVYKQENGKVTIDGPDGKVVLGEASEGELPKDFPLPVPEDTTVLRTGSMDSDKSGLMRTASLKSELDPTAVGDFYAKHLEQEGFKVKRTATKAGPMDMVMVAAEKDNVQVGAQAMAGVGESGTIVNLSWVEKR